MSTARRIVRHGIDLTASLPLLAMPLLWAAAASAQQDVPFSERTGYPIAPQGLEIPPLPDGPVLYKTAEEQDIRVTVFRARPDATLEHRVPSGRRHSRHRTGGRLARDSRR